MYICLYHNCLFFFNFDIKQYRVWCKFILSFLEYEIPTHTLLDTRLNKSTASLSRCEKSKLFMRFYFQIDSSLGSNHAFLTDVQWDAMEEDGYSASKPLLSNVNPAHLDFSDDNDRHKKGIGLLSK